MENNYPKDPIEEGKPPLDLENDNFIYPENDYDDYDWPETFPDDDFDPYDEEDYDDIFDDLEGLDESDLY